MKIITSNLFSLFQRIRIDRTCLISLQLCDILYQLAATCSNSELETIICLKRSIWMERYKEFHGSKTQPAAVFTSLARLIFGSKICLRNQIIRKGSYSSKKPKGFSFLQPMGCSRWDKSWQPVVQNFHICLETPSYTYPIKKAKVPLKSNPFWTNQAGKGSLQASSTKRLNCKEILDSKSPSNKRTKPAASAFCPER
ncbi:hypothetical protein F8388_019644 [Cannabis sativa]|uniref:Uncharacterized protein n=1 Tax=Cannabis sativa TaxID=3483 RepID=A0A7J6DUB3_CANSA|nr:hypothetical protein F8388_019644 [Cannabis sativa]KAF4350398.1 hypothetical protein G4B88_030916 [Cannabis sativa]